ncbi:MAG: hypothetical protein ACJ77N_09595 [Chloroflexota bacterium]
MADSDTAWPSDEPAVDANVEASLDDERETPDVTTAEDRPVPTAAPTRVPTSARKPTKFLADLSRAMQTAAEAAREQTLGQFQVDAKAFVELIHERTATEADALRKRADSDIAAIRDWSKAEIARIREETEQKITTRKTDLQAEIELHAARIERQIEHVQSAVAEFEGEMAAFFERLLGEDDPARFAAMAENLPEPPSFEDVAPEAFEPSWSAVTQADERDADAERGQDETTASLSETEGATSDGLDDGQSTLDADAESTSETVAPADEEIGPETTGEWLPEGSQDAVETAREQVAAEGDQPADGDDIAGTPEPTTDAFDPGAEQAGDDTEPGDVAQSAADLLAERIDGDGEWPSDFGAAEAEAALAARAESMPVEDDVDATALMDRLANLVPAGESPADDTRETQATQVVVVGLVSVASIASFKRHLGRVAGVQSVGVSSGPNGEFVFNVVHNAGVGLRDVVATLPGFAARVTDAGEGFVNVTAHDPDADA